jgi:hypothetical protein
MFLLNFCFNARYVLPIVIPYFWIVVVKLKTVDIK